MAEVRHRFGKGVYDFAPLAHKIRKRYRLDSPNKQGRSATRAPSLSAGVPLGDIQNGELFGADRVTVGVSRDSYRRVTPLVGTFNDNCQLGLNKEYSLSNKTQVENIERNPPLCRSYVKFRRTFYPFRSSRRQQSLGSRRLFGGQLVFIRAYTDNGTRSEPLYKTKTGYYEILGVTPTATQAQIKTAYYKQSFIYHPDRNAGSEEATVLFSEVSEAYTVLGNKALRKKYDRGLLNQSDLTTTGRPSAKDAAGSSAKPHAESRRSVVGAGRQTGGVFDFDAFFKEHYSGQLQRQKDIRVRREEMLRKKHETLGDRKLDGIMEMGVGVMLAMVVAILISLKRG